MCYQQSPAKSKPQPRTNSTPTKTSTSDSKTCSPRNTLSFSDIVFSLQLLKYLHCFPVQYNDSSAFLLFISSSFSPFFSPKGLKFNVENICSKLFSTATCAMSHLWTYISPRSIVPVFMIYVWRRKKLLAMKITRSCLPPHSCALWCRCLSSSSFWRFTASLLKLALFFEQYGNPLLLFETIL